MIICTRCQSTKLVSVHKSALDPAADVFQCDQCTNTFKRYDKVREKGTIYKAMIKAEPSRLFSYWILPENAASLHLVNIQTGEVRHIDHLQIHAEGTFEQFFEN